MSTSSMPASLNVSVYWRSKRQKRGMHPRIKHTVVASNFLMISPVPLVGSCSSGLSNNEPCDHEWVGGGSLLGGGSGADERR